MKYTILYLTLSLISSQLAAQEIYEANDDYNFTRHMLDVGIYDYSKASKKKYKIYHGAEADSLWNKTMMADEQLKRSGIGGYYMKREDGSEEFVVEEWADEYCPQLHYVEIAGGDGYVSIYDLKTFERLDTNPSTRAYSPNKKYRYGNRLDDGTKHYIEVLKDGKYIPYQFDYTYHERVIKGAYWHDENTLYYLLRREAEGDKVYWIGHSIKVEKK